MVQRRHQNEVSNGSQVTIEELARRQGIEPFRSLEELQPRNALFGEEEQAEFLEWVRNHRDADIA
jgi:hypothetical protein